VSTIEKGREERIRESSSACGNATKDAAKEAKES